MPGPPQKKGPAGGLGTTFTRSDIYARFTTCYCSLPLRIEFKEKQWKGKNRSTALPIPILQKSCLQSSAVKTNPNNTSDPSGNENKSGRSDGGSSLATVSLSSLRKRTPLSLCWRAVPPLCGGEAALTDGRWRPVSAGYGSTHILRECLSMTWGETRILFSAGSVRTSAKRIEKMQIL